MRFSYEAKNGGRRSMSRFVCSFGSADVGSSGIPIHLLGQGQALSKRGIGVRSHVDGR